MRNLSLQIPRRKIYHIPQPCIVPRPSLATYQYVFNQPSEQPAPMPLSDCRQVNENLALTMLLGRYVEGAENGNGAAADPIWLIGSTFQPRQSHPFSAKITFPFSQAAHVTRRGKEGSSLQRAPFPIPCLRHTRHVCPGTSRRTYVPLMKNPVTMAEGPGDSDTNFRRSAAPPSPISNISSSRNEEFRPRNSPLRAPLLLLLLLSFQTLSPA
jgi:hypothetical protein